MRAAFPILCFSDFIILAEFYEECQLQSFHYKFSSLRGALFNLRRVQSSEIINSLA
jgi:hypothetical protein